MPNGWKKFLAYSALSFLSLLFVAKEVMPNQESNRVLETSMLHILDAVAEDRSLPVDLAIEKVTLTKIANPNKDFNFYKYKANIIIANNGPGSLRSSQVSLSVNGGQKKAFLNNQASGFSLEAGEKHIVDGFEVIFDGDFNGGQIDFEVLALRKSENDLSNNRYVVNVFEGSPKIENIRVEEQEEPRNAFRISYDLENEALKKGEIELFLTEHLAEEIDDEDRRYQEVYANRQLIPYHLVRNSFETIVDANWSKRDIASYDPFRNFRQKYLFLKVTDPESGNYAISHILEFDKKTELTRAEFARLFVDKTDVVVFEDIIQLFNDVPLDHPYAPYIYSLHSYGLINAEANKFNPNQLVSRGEVLRVVLDYYDIDLEVNEGAPHFVDVKPDSYLYPYVETLVSNGKGKIFKDWFYVSDPASEYFLNYLLDAYRKDS